MLKREFKYLYGLCFAVFFINSFPVLSKDGNKKLDSLFTIVRSNAPDSTKANALTDIAARYLLFNVDSSFYFVDQYMAIGKKLEKESNEALHRKGINLQGMGILTKGNGYFYEAKYELTIEYANKAMEIYKKTNNIQGLASCNNTLGNAHMSLGKYDEAEIFFKKNYNNRKKLGVSKIVAAACNNLGLLASDRGDFKAAANYYIESLRIKDSIGDTKGVNSTYNNLGLLYARQNDSKTAIKYYQKSLDICLEIKDLKGQAVAYNNIGNAYSEVEKNYPEAIKLHEKALAIRQSSGDKFGEASSLMNLGSVYTILADSFQKNNNKAKAELFAQKSEVFLTKALSIKRDIKDPNGTASALNNLGSLMIYRNKIDQGILMCKEAYDIAIKLHLPEREKLSCKCLYEGYGKKKDYKNSFFYLSRFISVKDSLENAKEKKDLLAKTFEYEYEKKSLADSLKNTEQRKVDKLNFEREQDKQKYFTVSAIVVSVLMFVLFIVTFKNYSHKKKINQTLSQQNKIISEQKDEVEKKSDAINLQKEIIEEKNREILDSIQYAKRIQDAILPDTTLLSEFFSESFILFKPKDIVSGDFYWMEKKNDTLHVAVVDCTGHGVPGAFISLLGYNLLNRSINEFACTTTADVLTCMDQKLEELLKRSSIAVRDGMDLAFCSFEKKKDKINMSFSGAHNPAWIIRDKNQPTIGKLILEYDNYKLCELKATRQSIGGFTEKKPYVQHDTILEKGDMVYLFSDGYADQFGGDRGKKFKYGKLRELLFSITSKSLNEQKQALHESIESWRGTQSQVDDICVIGLRV
ncbi:MAG TPA: tetratricopeptide repeat protein [Bacteroidia bacterium]|nr:tetratricopeptide repeat protein [Bacteroidia bacterium]